MLPVSRKAYFAGISNTSTPVSASSINAGKKNGKES